MKPNGVIIGVLAEQVKLEMYMTSSMSMVASTWEGKTK
jgi:hypothetical protein